MNACGLLHFDAHFRNLLTDGRHIYFADFGLATSPRFELSEAESSFLNIHLSYDGCYTMTQLVNWLVNALTGVRSVVDRNEAIRRYATGDEPDNVPSAARAIIKRYAPIAVIMNEFFWKLHGESRMTPYPVDEIQRVCSMLGLGFGV
jgi:hypothetical protein